MEHSIHCKLMMGDYRENGKLTLASFDKSPSLAAPSPLGRPFKKNRNFS
jgi:hypothetical protein